MLHGRDRSKKIRLLAFLFAAAALTLSCGAAASAPFIPSTDAVEEMPASASLEVRYIAN